MTKEKAFTLGAEAGGERLDAVLASLLGLGLRGAKRLAGEGRALVDGVPRPPAYKVRPGQTVALIEAPRPQGEPSVRLLARGGGFAALQKPAGLHTAALKGGGGDSVEAALGELFPGEGAVLVNRLDRDTSGIVLAALDRDAAARYKILEDTGQVDKRYLAVVLGSLDAPLLLRREVDMARRARVKVLPGDSPDPLRATGVRPLAEGEGVTLVEARIAKGARHQIRAHLAAAGHPIAGDALYGDPGAAAVHGLRLHHWRVSLPGLCAACAPGWAEFQDVIQRVMEENPCA
ncbi:pseudouridine synthase family protein [Fundidesulfovibrio soli]|uniref:pseudouridine synthase family protein n=1 Tax=Fundidesulfovibrio soli TaxID=2922716 RepID=UPI001FB00FD9|nr:RNA pseudouridine synthase [Fundidesulfovibrio soli]